MTTIVNLYGGPGTGKSTSAAYLYYLLKARGANTELVREYVKDWAWEGRPISTYDQLYFLGKQTRRECTLYGKTDYVVTDSPVMMGLVYAEMFCPPSLYKGVKEATFAFYRQAAEDGHRHMHVFLKRSKPYNPQGRYQTESQAKDIDRKVFELLVEAGVAGLSCGTGEDELKEFLTKTVLRE